MAQTSFRNDPARIKKEMEISTFQGRYQLSAPGPGIDMPFQEDPQIRLQSFGANLMTNTIAIENELMGRNKILTRDIQEYKKNITTSNLIKYKSESPFILESRSSLPAWSFRGLDQKYQRFEKPWINPQANIEKEFNDNIQTRLLEKDIDVRKEESWDSWLPRKFT
jgi:hypothetical protein